MPALGNAIDWTLPLVPQWIPIDDGPPRGPFKPGHFILDK